MLRLTHHIVRRQFASWDRASQIGFILGAVLLLLFVALTLTASLENRPTLLVAAGAMLLVTQGVVLWANRGMVTPLAKAQRAYLAEDYDTVLELLEPLAGTERLGARGWMMLGSAYRQLTQFDKSLAALENVLRLEPNHHFSLYNFGRTLLVRGDYAAAVPSFEAALEAGAPEALRVDLGEALYRLGDYEAARDHLRRAKDAVRDDPPRALWVDVLLYRMGDAERPNDILIRGGLDYWLATAERFHSTPYGTALDQDIAALKNLL
jgi:tetratricopeptide (TPR) repeat protein